jgi:hypothetical protein
MADPIHPEVERAPRPEEAGTPHLDPTREASEPEQWRPSDAPQSPTRFGECEEMDSPRAPSAEPEVP